MYVHMYQVSCAYFYFFLSTLFNMNISCSIFFFGLLAACLFLTSTLIFISPFDSFSTAMKEVVNMSYTELTPILIKNKNKTLSFGQHILTSYIVVSFTVPEMLLM